MRIISGTARGTKLYTLEGNETRPTLDRVKESLFSIIQFQIPNAVVLDLFSGSGALALEALSRGAKRAILCDCSPKAIAVIQKNVNKTHFTEKAKIICKDFKSCLNSLTEKADLIFIDPPYQKNIAVEAVKLIEQKDLLTKNGLIILETDNEERDIEQIKTLTKLQMCNLKSYGRVKLIFLRREEG